MAIPKIIHYCWFGGNPFSKMEKECIESWKNQVTNGESLALYVLLEILH